MLFFFSVVWTGLSGMLLVSLASPHFLCSVRHTALHVWMTGELVTLTLKQETVTWCRCSPQCFVSKQRREAGFQFPKLSCPIENISHSLKGPCSVLGAMAPSTWIDLLMRKCVQIVRAHGRKSLGCWKTVLRLEYQLTFMKT